MILVLLSALALGQTCDELVHMVRADVPGRSIIADMRRSGHTFSRRELACLEANDVPDHILNEGRRLNDRGAIMEPQKPVTEPVAADATVAVELYCGSVEVVGVDAKHIAVSGTLQLDGRLDIDAEDPSNVRIVANHQTTPALHPPTATAAGLPKYNQHVRPQATSQRASPSCARIRVEIPRKARLVVSTSKATIRALWLHGDLDLRSHFGGITVIGGASDVVANSTSGAIHIDTPAEHVDVRSVSGAVEVAAGAGTRVQVDTVSGPIWVWGGPIRRMELTSVSGDIHFLGAVEPRGQLHMESHKGNIEGETPPGNAVRLQTYEGEAVTPVPYVRPDSWIRQKEGVVTKEGFGGFTGFDYVSSAANRIFRGGEFARWWFEKGAVITRSQSSRQVDFTLSAKSFSGDVRLGWRNDFPAATWSIIEPMESRSEAIEGCATAQYERAPGEQYGYAVISFDIDEHGDMKNLEIPTQIFSEEDVSREVPSGSTFSKCLGAALMGLDWPVGAPSKVVWPVRFGPPVPELELVDGPMVRPNSVGQFLDQDDPQPKE